MNHYDLLIYRSTHQALFVKDQSFSFTQLVAATYKIKWRGKTQPTFSTSDTLPTGVTLSSNGIVSYDGSINQTGVTNWTVTAMDGVDTVTANMTTTMNSATVEIADGQTISFQLGTASSMQIQYTADGTPTFAVTSGTLPSGVTMTTGGLLEYDGTGSTDVSTSVEVTATLATSASDTATIGVKLASIPQDYIWYTPFTSDYKEMTSGIVGVPNQPNAFSIATDNSKFGTGYLAARKTTSDTVGIEYANTATYMDLSAGTITISLWLRAPNWAQYSQLLGGTRSGDYKDGWVLYKDGGSTDHRLDFRSRQNDNRFTTAVDDGEWHHWLFTRTAAGAWTWYKDGVVDTSGTGDTGSINGSAQNMKIGGGTNWSKQAYFDLAHFRVYDRVLDSTEIGKLYHEFDESSDSSSSMSDSSSSISDLIFHAPFTTDLSDIAGNRTATPTDSGAADVTITTKDGKSCVYVPNNARLLYSPCGDVPLGNTSKSMSIWVNMDFTNSGWNGIFAVGENSRYKLFMLSTNNSWKVSYGGSWNDVYSTSQLHSGWNHMAVTYDTTAIKLYHDGVLVHTSQQSDKVDTAETNICVGGRPAASDNYCESAWFSDARIYSRALTDAEILSIYQEGL